MCDLVLIILFIIFSLLEWVVVSHKMRLLIMRVSYKLIIGKVVMNRRCIVLICPPSF